MAASLADLVQRARETNTGLQNSQNLALGGLRLERSVQQTRVEAKLLAQRTARGTGDAKTQAQIPLARHGIDVEDFERNIKSLNLKPTLQPFSGTPANVEDFLKSERQNAIMAVMTTSLNKAEEDFRARHQRHMEHHWEEQQNSIRDVLQIGSMLDQEPVVKPRDLNAPMDYSSMDSRMHRYAQVVMDAARAQAQEASYPFVQRMKECSSEVEVASRDDIKDAWSIISGLLQDEKGNLPEDAGHYEKRWSGDRLGHLIANSRRVLESRYTERMKRALNQGQYQGSVLSKDGVDDYVRIVLGSEANGSNEQDWARLYYCLRTGNLDLAFEFANYFDAKDILIESLDAYKSNKRSRVRGSVEQYYRQASLHNAKYERAVWNILGVCERERDAHREVAVNVEDFIWIKLSLLPVEEKDVAPAMHQLQRLLSETYGESHFQADREPWKYLRILLLSLQFEKAVHFLSLRDTTLALHFALPLYWLGVLAITPSMQFASLRAEEEQGASSTHQINLGLILQRYVHAFYCTDVEPALHYLYLMRDLQWRTNEDEGRLSGDSTPENRLFHRLVKDMALKTRRWNDLFGVLHWDDNKIHGGQLLQLFKGREQELRTFIRDIALAVEKQGALSDAINLFDMANELKRALELMVTCLSQAGSIHSAAEFQDLQLLAEQMQQHRRFAGEEKLMEKINLLLRVQTLLRTAREGDVIGCEKAIQHSRIHLQLHAHLSRSRLYQELDRLNVIPCRLESVRACVDNCKALPDEVRRFLSDLLVNAMKCWHFQFHQQKQSQFSKSQEKMDQCQKAARALSEYSGQVSQVMPSSLAASLIGMENSML
ncbi:uncharacterized protein MONBRDRAFT_32309 [Monosiga brevicollis MX1]|uniref:Nuclear pore protein n=1 Tax=Monosiga brevicollis TaxID=81824 RepID=A9UYQ3_MONBE|nr:uncharacterized protein MONBRDRAFT_32309 [Monosiga brevicollis MX1]EDQ89645.1 predicted protein [Monosiga brevicollis MX1]|eukprot:XP_001745674.1 hypothetical protein [Monosiga brevicollis MX1]